MEVRTVLEDGCKLVKVVDGVGSDGPHEMTSHGLGSQDGLCYPGGEPWGS